MISGIVLIATWTGSEGAPKMGVEAPYQVYLTVRCSASDGGLVGFLVPTRCSQGHVSLEQKAADVY